MITNTKFFIAGLALMGAMTSGCFLNPGDEATMGCQDTKTDISADEETALGFSADDVLAALDETYGVNLDYFDGTSTDLTVSFVAGDDFRYVSSELVSSGDGAQPTIEIDCADRVEIDGQLIFTTADGVFDEVLDVTLSAVDAQIVSIYADLVSGSVGGSYEPMRFAPEDYDAVSSAITVEFNAGEIGGHVAEYAEAVNGETASMSMLEVGTFGLYQPSEKY